MRSNRDLHYTKLIQNYTQVIESKIYLLLNYKRGTGLGAVRVDTVPVLSAQNLAEMDADIIQTIPLIVS